MFCLCDQRKIHLKRIGNHPLSIDVEEAVGCDMDRSILMFGRLVRTRPLKKSNMD
jgi:hypothetical protein